MAQTCAVCIKPARLERRDKRGSEVFCSLACGNAYFEPIGVECRTDAATTQKTPVSASREPHILAVLAHAEYACLLERPIGVYRVDNDTYMLPTHVVQPLRAHFYGGEQPIAGKRDAESADVTGTPARARQAREFSALEEVPMEVLAAILENLDLQALLRALRTSRTLASLAMMPHVFARALQRATLAQLDAGLDMLAKAKLLVKYNHELIVELARAWHVAFSKQDPRVDRAIVTWGASSLAEFVLYAEPPAYTKLPSVLANDDVRKQTCIALHEHVVAPLFEQLFMPTLTYIHLTFDRFVDATLAHGTHTTEFESRRYRLLVHFVHMCAFLQRPHPLLEGVAARIALVWNAAWAPLVKKLQMMPNGKEVLQMCVTQSGLGEEVGAQGALVEGRSPVRAATALGETLLYDWIRALVRRDIEPAGVEGSAVRIQRQVLADVKVLVPLARTLCRSTQAIYFEPQLAAMIAYRIVDNDYRDGVLEYLIEAFDTTGEDVGMMMTHLVDTMIYYMYENAINCAAALSAVASNAHWINLFAHSDLATLRAELERLVTAWNDYLSTEVEIKMNRNSMEEASEQFHEAFQALLQVPRLHQAAEGMEMPLQVDYMDDMIADDDDGSSSASASQDD